MTDTTSNIYESIFTELRTKHDLILPLVKPGTVSFSFKGSDSRRYTYHYFKSSIEWELLGKHETPESKAVMDDLIKTGIITEDGKVNFEHHI